MSVNLTPLSEIERAHLAVLLLDLQRNGVNDMVAEAPRDWTARLSPSAAVLSLMGHAKPASAAPVTGVPLRSASAAMPEHATATKEPSQRASQSQPSVTPASEKGVFEKAVPVPHEEAPAAALHTKAAQTGGADVLFQDKTAAVQLLYTPKVGMDLDDTDHSLLTRMLHFTPWKDQPIGLVSISCEGAYKAAAEKLAAGLQESAASVLILLGQEAMSALAGKEVSYSEAVQARVVHGKNAVYLYHPKTMRRQPILKRLAWAEWLTAMAVHKEGVSA